ncbi:phage tail length tape measure family protein [Bosea sp. TAF32]|uniref:phage tail length tape measure family protein n=1 Tax=Bosea sp. TAF32 TaxID=3237482 RepID=UPI003F8EC4BD
MAAKVAADQQGIASSERLGAALAAEDAATGKISRSVEAMSRRWITGYGHQAKFESGLRQINRALETGAVNTTRAAALVEGLQRKFGQTADAVQVGQRGFTMLAPVVHEVNERLAAQSVNLTRLTAANSNAVAGTAQFTRGAGLARYELVNLGRQVGDIGTMLAMGSSPFQILASQGAQVADVFTTTSASIGSVIRQIGGGALRFATSGAGLATGAGAILAAGTYSAISYADAQRQVENALRGVGAASGVSLAGINRFAAAEAAAGKVSTASAREIGAAFASTGRVDPTKLPGIGSFTKDFAAFTGLGMDDSMKELASAFADPSKGAAMLAGKIGGLNSAALRWVQAQQAAGDMLGAQRTLMQTFAQQVEGATGRTGLFARAWDSVKRSVSDADNALGRALNGSTDAERLASLQQQRDRLQQTPGLGVANQFRMLEAQIRPLEAIVELERQREAIDARVAKAGNASLAASAIADQLDPYRKQMEELVALQTKLDEARKLNKGAPEYEEWGRALDRVKGAIGTLLPNVERERLAHDLAMRAISARTLEERVAIEVAREGLRLSGEKISAAEREIAMNRKAAEVQAQANREARDALREARDQQSLAGLRPHERRMAEIAIEERNNRERFGVPTSTNGAFGAGGYVGEGPFLPGSASLPATTGALRGLDAAFAESLRRAMADIPGLTITGGMRTYEQQAALYEKYGPSRAARPGNSNHEMKGGLPATAADLAYNGSGQIPQEIRDRLTREYGIGFPLANPTRGTPEPWHAEPVGARGGGDMARAIAQSKEAAAATENYNSVIRSANDNIGEQERALQIQAKALTATAYETGRAEKAQELYNQLAANGVPVTRELAAAIEQTADRYGRLREAAASVKLTQDVQFERDQLGRTSGEQQIASRLRGTGVGMDSAIADQMRFNQLLGETKSVAGDAMKGFISDLRSGKSGMEALRGVLDKFATKLFDLATDQLISGLFKGMMGGSSGGGLFGSLFSGGGGLFGSMFGGGGLGLTPGAGGLYANGGVFAGGMAVPFANGGAFSNSILTSPTLFRFADGGTVRRGLAGEAGPEAVMPLRRNSSGQLGVMAAVQSPANSNSASRSDAPVIFQVNAQGAGPREIDELKRVIPGLAVRAIQEARRNRVAGL